MGNNASACSKKHAEGTADKVNTLNVFDQLYVNAGCWQSGRTDFVLVGGRDIIFCSWGNFLHESSIAAGGIRVDSAHCTDLSYLWCKEHRIDLLSNPCYLDAHPKLVSFLRGAPEDRAWPLLFHRSDSPMTKDDEIYVFVGDTHIHLYKEWLCDNFVRPKESPAAMLPGFAKWKHVLEAVDEWKKEGFVTDRQSLASDFEAFVDYAEQIVTKSKLIQVGDLYEIWEVQCLYELAFEALEELRMPAKLRMTTSVLLLPGLIIPPPLAFDVPDWVKRPFESSWLSDSKSYDEGAEKASTRDTTLYPYVSQIALPHYFGYTGADDTVAKRAKRWAKAATPRDVLAVLAYRFEFSEHASAAGALQNALQQLKQGDEILDFTNDSDVRARIRAQYPGTTFWNRMTTIPGNHDSTAANKYLLAKFKGAGLADVEEMDNCAHEDEKPNVDPPADPKRTLVIGRPHDTRGTPVIVVEHGNAFDEYNNDLSYYRGTFRKHDMFSKLSLLKGNGYHKCRYWVFQELSNPTGMFIQEVGPIAETGVGDDPTTATAIIKGLVHYADERMMALFGHNSWLRLVVMGHTHVATLKDVKRWRLNYIEYIKMLMMSSSTEGW